MSCKPTYKGKRYNSLEELYRANGINPEQKQQVLEQYSQYLNTIFPDSKAKDIFYHGGGDYLKNENFKFNVDRQKRNLFFNKVQGVYFTPLKENAQWYADMFHKNGNVLPVIINAKNSKIVIAPKHISNVIGFDHENITEKEKLQLIEQGYDSVIALYPDSNEDQGYKKGDIKEFVALNSEQIHMLGSKQDIEGFKKFVDSNQSSEQFNDSEIGVIKDTIIKRLLKDEENSENSITFAEVDKLLDGGLSDALKSNLKTPEELWSNLNSVGKIQLIDCL